MVVSKGNKPARCRQDVPEDDFLARSGCHALPGYRQSSCGPEGTSQGKRQARFAGEMFYKHSGPNILAIPHYNAQVFKCKALCKKFSCTHALTCQISIAFPRTFLPASACLPGGTYKTVHNIVHATIA